MTDDNSKIPAQDMTSTDTDNNGNDEQDTSPRVFDITSDLNIAPVKDDDNANTSTPNETVPTEKDLNLEKKENLLNLNQFEKTIDINNSKIVIEPQFTAPVTPPKTEKLPENNPQKPPTPQFGPANPPAKTLGMNRMSFNANTSQENKNETGQQKNLQEAIATIKTTPTPAPAPKIIERPWEAKPDSKIKPLRTYETDFAEAMAKKRISSASIAIAENKKKEQEKEVVQNQPINIVVPKKFPDPVQQPIQPVDYRKEPFKQNPVPKPTPNPIPSPQINPTPNPVPIKEAFVKNDILKDAVPPEDKVIVKNPRSTKNWLLLIFSLILICGGVYSAFYLYKKSPLAPSPVNVTDTQSSQVESMKSIVSPDSKVLLNITDKNQSSIISAIKTEISKPQQEKTLKEIVLTKSTENTISKVGAQEMIEKTRVSLPDILSRSLNDEWMLGVYSGIGEQKSLFIITTNNFFQNTFAGLIQWEKTMPEDLKQYIYSDSNMENFTIRGQYKDKIIKNKDVREYVADNGHISFLYSFISNDKLVITNSEEALEEIVTRLEKDAFIR